MIHRLVLGDDRVTPNFLQCLRSSTATGLRPALVYLRPASDVYRKPTEPAYARR